MFTKRDFDQLEYGVWITKTHAPTGRTIRYMFLPRSGHTIRIEGPDVMRGDLTVTFDVHDNDEINIVAEVLASAKYPVLV